MIVLILSMVQNKSLPMIIMYFVLIGRLAPMFASLKFKIRKTVGF